MNDELDVVRRSFRDIPTCRVATVRPDGGPHVAARWFVWLEDGVWIGTRVGDDTWEHVGRDPRVSFVVDRGRDWVELAGIRMEGVGERYPAEHPDLRASMSAFHEKYRPMFANDGFERFAEQVPALGFVRVVPAVVDAWDHRRSSGP